MRNIGRVLKSVRGMGALSCLLLLCGGTAGALGFLGLATALISLGVVFLVGMVQGVERRRHTAQRKLLHSVQALAKQLERNDTRIRLEHKQQTNSIGLLFRELSSVKSAVSGEDSVISLHSEQQLATFLRAMSINTQELVDSLETSRAEDPVREK